MTTRPRRLRLKPRRAPLQDRSRQMVEAILEAAARVLRRHSLAGFNTNRVAELAGISIGSLYQYFPNKDALTAALVERSQTELAAQVEALVAAAQDWPLVAALDALVDAGLRRQLDDGNLAAALDYEEQRLPLRDVLQQTQGRIQAALATLLRRHPAELTVHDVDEAAADLFVIVRALIDAAGLARLDSREAKRRVRRAVLGYLTCSPTIAAARNVML
jgi:AcrR family transcriptional regulator